MARTYTDVPEPRYVEKALNSEKSETTNQILYVELGDSTQGTLSSKVKQEILSSPLVVFLCGGKYYYKSHLTSTTLILTSIHPTPTVVGAETDVVVVVLSTGAWTKTQLNPVPNEAEE